MNSIKQYKVENMSFIEIDNNSGFKVTLVDFGASVYTIYFNNELMNVQVEDPKQFLHPYVRYGKTIGRTCGRIAGASYTANGKTYNVTKNEGMNCLHGGDCFAQATFEIKSIQNHMNGTKVIFHYLSKDGENGFGGNFDIDVIYRVSARAPILNIEYNCICDQACPMNITSHAYYCLGDDSINNLTLYMNAKRYAFARYADLIQTEIRLVPSWLNFTKPKLICKDIENPHINLGKLCGYDHFFMFDDVDIDTKQVILKNDRYTMTLYTDYDGVQVYTNNNAKPIKCLNTKHERRRGVALEPQTSSLSNNTMIAGGHRLCHIIQLHFAKNN